MKKCTYCGRENDDDAIYCSGCFQDDQFSRTLASPSHLQADEPADELVTLTTCARLADADLVVSRLASADIEAFIPDQYLMQTVGFNLNTYGYIRVQVRRKDYADAKTLLAQPSANAVELPVSAADGWKTIALLEVGQTEELMIRLQQQGIPAGVRPANDEGGLDMCEIIVEASFYERGCDVVEAWDAERVAAQKRRLAIHCRRCGSQNYRTDWNEKVGTIYHCKDCGSSFVR